MNLLVAIRGWDPEPWVERFRTLLPDRAIVTPQDIFDPTSIHYAAVWKHEPGILGHLPNLRAIFSLGAGVDHIFADADLPLVPIVRVVDEDLRDRMSEWVLLHVLMHHRQQRMYDWQQHEKIWDEDVQQPAASDVRIGILGLGVLGTDAATKLKLVGFDVAGWSRSRKRVPGIGCFAGDEELPAFLARTDILVCLLPLTPQTRGILNRKLFEGLARDGRHGAGPILLNAGRGGLQNEQDILECLEDGTLQAASLDVFVTEPLPADSPLWEHPRVTISPHNAAISEASVVANYVAHSIEAFERGEALENAVDRQLQY